MTVKQARLLADKTRADMAKILGISLSTYDNKERNRTPWLLNEAYSFAEAVNRPLDEIDFFCTERSKNETQENE